MGTEGRYHKGFKSRRVGCRRWGGRPAFKDFCRVPARQQEFRGDICPLRHGYFWIFGTPAELGHATVSGQSRFHEIQECVEKVQADIGLPVFRALLRDLTHQIVLEGVDDAVIVSETADHHGNPDHERLTPPLDQLELAKVAFLAAVLEVSEAQN